MMKISKNRGRTHQKIQEVLLGSIPEGKGFLERRFDEISRIADVAWPEKKLVFEVQFSTMDPLEARKRTHDYALLGWQVVWIVHENVYNPLRPSPFQEFLKFFPHYYTNIDDLLGGTIFDLLVFKEGGVRRSDILIGEPKRNALKVFPPPMEERGFWRFHFCGDWLDKFKSGNVPGISKRNMVWNRFKNLFGATHAFDL